MLALFGTGCASSDARPSSTPSVRPTGPVPVTLAVYGPEPVIAAYKEIAARYTVAHPTVKIVVQPYATHDEAMAALQSSTAKGDPPDVFLMDHDDLAGLDAQKAVRRVDDLLAAREVDFGDGFTRNGLEAFSSDAALQCMPTDVSPLVVYYNPKLIELDRIADPGRNPVTPKDGWSLDEFGRAAIQARRPGVRGLYVAPTLEQVAPFIWSGGGDVVDDTDHPTTLTLAEGPSASAMEKLLELVRNPALTFNEDALRSSSALDRFKDGRLGMILGYRSLTPVLRAQQSLTFDVMPMPKVSSGATIGSMSGMCISSKSGNIPQAADFLTQVISHESASTLAATGYVVPSNIDVINSEAFLQGGQRPLNSDVFPREVRDARLLPSTPEWAKVAGATALQLTQLFYDPVILPLQDRLAAIDAASVPLLQPPPSASPSPTN
jgi:multiple sugar transport system substrate-binding protein